MSVGIAWMLATASALLLVVALPAQEEGPYTTALALVEGLDLDSQEVVDPLGGAGSEATDLFFAYDSSTPDGWLVVCANEVGGAAGTFREGEPFSTAGPADPEALSYSGAIVNRPFGPDDSYVVRTAEGSYYKVGNAAIDDQGVVTFDVVRLP